MQEKIQKLNTKLLGFLNEQIVKVKPTIDVIKPVFSFVRDCVHEVTFLPENPNVFDYVDLGCSFKEKYEDTFARIETILYFADQKWWIPCNESFYENAISLLTNAFPKKINNVRDDGIMNVNTMKFDDLEIGWIDQSNHIRALYIRKAEQRPAFVKLIHECFWARHESGRVMISEVEGKLNISDDTTTNDFVITKRSEEYANYIREFLNQGYGRSILFYGPPGSGKTSAVSGICKMLNLKTLRFADILNFNRNFIIELIEIMAPDAIILDDIDNLGLESIGDLLTRLESFNKQKKLIFATANQVTKLDDALIRPGRFDQAIEVNCLDEEVLRVLIGNDPEIYEIVKKFPVAFTVELMTRVKVLGKDRALANIGDLISRVKNLDKENYSLEKEDGEEKVDWFDPRPSVPSRRGVVGARQIEAAMASAPKLQYDRYKKRIRA